MPRPARRPAPRFGDRGFGAYTADDLDALTARAGLTPGQRLRTRAAAAVLGFRTTSYVTSELIDWSAAPGDPIYRLVFPEEMLPAAEVTRIAGLLRGQAPRARIAAAARRARAKLPAGPAPCRAQDTPPGACRASSDRCWSSPGGGTPAAPPASPAPTA